MRFLADMGVALRVVERLRAEGHDVIHLREEGLHRLPNGAILDKAAAERRLERLGKVLKDSGQAIEQGAVVVIEESRRRVRRLPLGG